MEFYSSGTVLLDSVTTDGSEQTPGLKAPELWEGQKFSGLEFWFRPISSYTVNKHSSGALEFPLSHRKRASFGGSSDLDLNVMGKTQLKTQLDEISIAISQNY